MNVKGFILQKGILALFVVDLNHKYCSCDEKQRNGFINSRMVFVYGLYPASLNSDGTQVHI